MEQFFLITGTISKTEYMGNSKKFADMKNVRANSTEEAREKYEKYWDDKSDNYGDVYRVYHCEVIENIY